MDPQSYNEARTRPSLEERLESIISGAALMADSSCTRDDRRERIVQECTTVRQALQDLLSEYMNNVSASRLAFVILLYFYEDFPIVLFIRFFCPVRYCYHVIAWMAWTILIKLTGNKYLLASTEWLMKFWRSKVMIAGGHWGTNLVNTISHELLEPLRWTLHGIATSPYWWAG